jgi:prepilin-type N-terminal cleavage/methylation domain-containing protein
VKSSKNGFTLVELMIVFTILAVIVAISYLAYQHGAKREYGLSQQARSLATALQLARMQALDNKTAISITNARSTDLLGTWYTKVQITAANHGVKPGDYVAISGLKIAASATSTETPMTGAYYVYGTAGNTFDCVYYHSDSLQATPAAVGRNLTRSSQLIIQKKSLVEALASTDEKYARYKSSQFFIYDDSKFQIWDQADAISGIVNTTTTVPTDVSPSDYSPSPGFTTRGFPASESGNELRIMAIPIKQGDVKVITITPFGQVMLGTSR